MDIFLCKKQAIPAAVCAGACIMMVIYPEITMDAARKSISIWASDVLPAMLPFFICINILNGTGFMEKLPGGSYPFAVSVISGYPAGAKVIGDMCRTGLIDGRKGLQMFTYCSTSGPAFIAGTVGAGMLGIPGSGLIIAISHYGGAIVNGLISSRFIKSGGGSYHRKVAAVRKPVAFSEAVYGAMKSMAVILAYILVFMVIIELADKTGIVPFSDNPMMKGFFEMTVGCSSLAGGEADEMLKCAMASAIISWGGLSVIGQSISMVSGSGIPVIYMVAAKAFHCLYATIIALFMGWLVL